MNFVKRFRAFFKRSAPKHFSDVCRNQGLERFEVDNWTISEFLLEVLVPIVGIRPYPLNELAFMTAAVSWVKPTHIFEWGTHIGKSARIFYEIGSAFKQDIEIFSIDLPDDVNHVEHPRESRGQFVKDIKSVRLFQGDGVRISLDHCRELKAVQGFKPLFYIDGDHSYENVLRELTEILNEVKNPSFLLHDTFFQSAESGYNVGPYKAILESFGTARPEYKIRVEDDGLPGMTFLYLD